MSSPPISPTPSYSQSSERSTSPATPPPPSETSEKATQVAQQRIHTPPSAHPQPKLQSRNISILKGVGYGLLGLVGTITGIALIALSGGTVLIVGAGAAATAGMVAGGTGALIVGAAATYKSGKHLNVAKKTPWSPLPPRSDFEKFYNEKKKHLLRPISGEANLSNIPNMEKILTDVALDIARGSVICYQGTDYPTTEQQKEMASWPFERRRSFARTILDELCKKLETNHEGESDKLRRILFLCQQSFPAESVLRILVNQGQQKMIEGLDPTNPLFFCMPSDDLRARGGFRVSIEESKEGTNLSLDAPGAFCVKTPSFPDPQDCYVLGVQTTLTIDDGETAHFEADVQEEGRLDRVLAERFYYSPTQFFNLGVGVKIVGNGLNEELGPPKPQDLAKAASDLTNKLKKASQVIEFKEVTYEDANALVQVLKKEGLSDSTILAVLTRCDPSLPRFKIKQNYEAFLSSIGIPPKKRKRYRLTSLPTKPIALKITKDNTATLSYPDQKFHFVDPRHPGSPVSGEITCNRSITVTDDGATKHSLAMTMEEPL